MTNCDLCNTQDYEIIYDGVIRDGVVGTKTKVKHKVVNFVVVV